MAGVVVRGFERQAACRRNQPQVVEKFVDVANLAGQILPCRLTLVVPMMAIILEHRAAACHVDDHRIDVAGGKRPHVGVGQFARRLAGAGVKVNRSATDLLARHHDFTAVLL